MNDLDFRQEVLDPLSSSFCAAKWYNATIWLGSGQTTSCHHPPAHKIPSVELLKENPKLIHNTPEKKLDRDMMRQGERPPGCEYCWKIEDMELLGWGVVDVKQIKARKNAGYQKLLVVFRNNDIIIDGVVVGNTGDSKMKKRVILYSWEVK